ncbi:unnamed protein product [Cuscuta epithymum]|uniref:Reverse transcriptase zinc-binding domain-containing protein n=1 Tax=Cuscuta epithymum TaxID=186058 RepID=A0AAV0CQH9_9ASTE|nr:unnamed protein product [Cuscuta epithymum]
MEKGSWNDEMLSTCFSTNKVSAIRNIPLSSRLLPDSLYWWPAKDGVFTVRTAYWLGVLGPMGLKRDNDKTIWQRVWELKALPKMKHFLWRAISGSLATRERL